MACVSVSAWKHTIIAALSDPVSVSNTSIPFKPSKFLLFSSISYPHHRKHLFVAAASCDSSDSYSSNTATRKVIKDKILVSDLEGCMVESVKEKTGVEISSEILHIVVKSVGRKRPPWYRILFSSKKIRSIILLNVITLVYGMFPNFSLSFNF